MLIQWYSLHLNSDIIRSIDDYLGNKQTVVSFLLKILFIELQISCEWMSAFVMDFEDWCVIKILLNAGHSAEKHGLSLPLLLSF